MDALNWSDNSFEASNSEKLPPTNGYHHTYTECAIASLPPSPQNTSFKSTNFNDRWKCDDERKFSREELVFSSFDHTLTEEQRKKLEQETSHLSIEQVIPMLADLSYDVDKVIDFCKNVKSPTLMCESTEQLFISSCNFMKRKLRNSKISEAPGLRTFFMTKQFKGNNFKTLIQYYYEHKKIAPYFMQVGKKKKEYEQYQVEKLRKIQHELEKQENEERRVAKEERKRVREEKARQKLLSGEKEKVETKKRKIDQDTVPIPTKRARLRRSVGKDNEKRESSARESLGNGSSQDLKTSNSHKKDESVSPSNSVTKSGRAVVRREPIDAEDRIINLRKFTKIVTTVQPQVRERKLRTDWPERIRGRFTKKAVISRIKSNKEIKRSSESESSPNDEHTKRRKSTRGKSRKPNFLSEKFTSTGEESSSTSSQSSPVSQTYSIRLRKLKTRVSNHNSSADETREHGRCESQDCPILTLNRETGNYEIIRADQNDPNFVRYLETAKRRLEENSRKNVDDN